MPLMAGGTRRPNAGMIVTTIPQDASAARARTGKIHPDCAAALGRLPIGLAVADKSKRKAQTACKPGSVPPCGFSSHSSATRIAARLVRHTRDAGRRRPKCIPYSVLLLAGFTMRAASPKPRWALTPPFHPYPGSGPGRFAFCGTFPRLAPGGRYPPPCLRGARTFLQQASLPATAQPSGALAIEDFARNGESLPRRR